MDNYKTILEYFNNAEEPVRAGTVAEETGIDRKEVDKVRNQLKKEEKIVSPKRCFWEIKK